MSSSAISETDGATATPALEARGVSLRFTVRRGVRRGVLHAVDDVDLALHPREVVALIGESGSGKTSLARVLARMYPPSDGAVLLHGDAVAPRRRRARRTYHGQVQLVFQDPFASLNPLHRVRVNLERPLRLHRPELTTAAQRTDAAAALLRAVDLHPAESFLDAYPHELSGGQRQRVVVARALAVRPTVLLADEPISMLDVSIRIGVLNMLRRLADEGIALLYITHDIASARYISDRAVVMYAGQVVESGPTDQVIDDPQHPYTRLLLAAAPRPGGPGTATTSTLDALDVADAEPPDLIEPPRGCRFAARCPHVTETCRRQPPPVVATTADRTARCWLHVTDATVP